MFKNGGKFKTNEDCASTAIEFLMSEQKTAGGGDDLFPTEDPLSVPSVVVFSWAIDRKWKCRETKSLLHGLMLEGGQDVLPWIFSLDFPESSRSLCSGICLSSMDINERCPIYIVDLWRRLQWISLLERVYGRCLGDCIKYLTEDRCDGRGCGLGRTCS